MRLMTLLSNVSEIKLSAASHNLAERLGHLMGLSGSVALARTLQYKPQGEYASQLDAAEDVQQRVLTVRERMMRTISNSFAHDDNEEQTKVPSADVTIRAQALQHYEPYRRFYVAHQLEMAVCVQNLRAEVRKKMALVSPELSELAELDRTIEEGLVSYNRKLFNVTLKVLERRFKSLLAEHLKQVGDVDDNRSEVWLKPGAWLDRFYQDMRELLLAEFDVRLQPVLGLLEALNENTKI